MKENKKELLENLGATELCILTYALSGLMAGVGAGLMIIAFL